MGEIRQIIAKNLRDICEAKGIKHKNIAEALNVSNGSVANWFKGTNGIDIENLVRVCEYIGITLDQVYGLKPTENNLNGEALKLVNVFEALNQRGKTKVIEYANDLMDTGKYASSDTVSADKFIEERRVDNKKEQAE